MKTIKPMTLGALNRPYTFLGSNRMVVAALGFFRLGADNERLLEDNLQWPVVLPLLPAGMALDEVMPKPCAEALVLGQAWAPHGKPVKCLCVRMKVGAIDKVVPVTGDCGCDGDWLHAPLAGFGPLAATMAPRKDKYGTYGKRWLAKEAPGFASDIDWSVFNVAREDQWLPDSGYFEGGEAYRLEGMHPTIAVIEGRLPRIKARAFLLAKDAQPSASAEVAMHLDTVWFLPAQQLGILVYHGQHEIGDSDGLDIGTLMVAYENTDEPKTLAHYHQVMGWRRDLATSSLHAFDEGQLAPALSAETQAARAAARESSLAAEQDKRQQLLSELDAQQWKRMGRPAPEGYTPPQAPPMPPGSPSKVELETHDFNLTEMVEQAKARVETVRLEGEEKLAKMRADPQLTAMMAAAAKPDPEQQFADALQRAIVPAYDLFPAEQTGRDPASADQAAQLERAHAAGLIDDERYRKALDALAGAPALKRSARRIAPKRSGPALAESAGLRLGQQVRTWLAEGLALAGRDLAGVDLRGIVLDGADLRQVMLENADLRGASLRGADLRGAVLTEAKLAGANFGNANLDGANLSGSDAEGASFAGASLRDAQAIKAIWRRADLQGATLDKLLAMNIDLTGATLDRVRAKHTLMLEASADDSSWRGAVLESVVAIRASFIRADFRDAQLTACTVIEADLGASNFQSATLDRLQAAAKETNFRGANLRGVRATSCGLHGACLSGADLTASHWMRCDFGECQLDGSRFDRAHLPHSNLMAANARAASLRGADFYQAICRKADFREADLTGARFVKAEMTGVLMSPTEAAA
jgi:uncharacterized protein YjbI with pentapeptide repeats